MKSFLLVVLALLLSPASSVATASQDSASAQAGTYVLETPRETVRTLIEGVLERSDAGMRRAVQTLDLSWVPSMEREALGEKWALLLKEGVLDRLGVVDYDSILIPSQGAGLTGKFTWLHGDEASRRVDFHFALVGGSWRFSEEFVRNIGTLAEGLADVEISEAVLDGLPLLERLRRRIRSKMPAIMLSRTFLLENWQWASLLVLIILGVIADRIVRFLLSRIAKRIAESNRLKIDKDVLTNFERPFGYFVTAALFVCLLPVVGIERSIERILISNCPAL